MRASIQLKANQQSQIAAPIPCGKEAAMGRQLFSDAKLFQYMHCKIPSRELWGRERSTNQAFSQAHRAFRKQNWRIVRLVPATKMGE
jgi:hypothetical protein